MNKKPAKRDRRIKQIYSGVLAEPGPNRFRFSVKSLLSKKTFFTKRSPEQIRSGIAAEVIPDVDNLILLLNHYGIEHDDADQWFYLAFALARDHVPAFKNPPARGGRRKTIDKLGVYNAVRKQLSGSDGMSESWAIGEVKKKLYPEIPKKTVASWFYDAVKIVEASGKESIEREELLAQGLRRPTRG